VRDYRNFLYYLLVFGLLGCREADLRPTFLRCEARVAPVGLDTLQPRLTWQLENAPPSLLEQWKAHLPGSLHLRRGRQQRAYRIVVAGSREALAADRGDRWDSLKVASDQTAHIVYGGSPLESGREYWWKVRVWDRRGRVSPWSEPARWTMGLLDAQQWQGQWISQERLAFEDCKWVWYPKYSLDDRVPPGILYFRTRLFLPEGQRPQRARFLLTADDQFTLFVNGHTAGQSDGEPRAWLRPQTIDVIPYLVPGQNILAVEATNISPRAAGLVGKLCIDYDSGERLVLQVDRTWKVSEREQPGWNNSADFDDSDWPAAVEIAEEGEGFWGPLSPGEFPYLPPSPYLRKEFYAPKPVRRAVVSVAALGLYQLYLNGRRVGEDVFTPGWPYYPKRIYYNTYEVTEQVLQGANAIGAILADGWYSGFIGWDRRRCWYGHKPQLLLQLRLEYADGTEQIVVSDGSWKTFTGPILEGDFYMGETYDARRELPPWWCNAGFDDSAWEPVCAEAQEAVTTAALSAYPCEPVRKVGEIDPVSLNEPSPGVYVFDLGQNIAGWARLKVQGPAGTRVVLRFAERLKSDGTLYTDNYRSARATDTYILKGEREEIWEPRFTYRGFRYVEVTGYPGRPSLEVLTGVVVRSDLRPAGGFRCSSPLVNRIYHNLLWSQRGNLVEVPTESPQRDERLGWTGDAQVFFRTATYNMDCASFFSKWLQALEDSQQESGVYTHVAPDVWGAADSPGWADAGILIPYQLYQVYGDTGLIERHFDSMARYIEYLRANSENFLRPAIGFGDWVSLDAGTPKDVIATAYFAHVCRRMAEMAEVVGRPEKAQEYQALFENVKAAFNAAYVAPDGRIQGDTQTAYALALGLDLLPEEQRPAAVRHLVSNIESRGGHLSTGFLGTQYLLPALSRFGRGDAAYRLLTNETFPSWGFMVKQGATTVWERWDGWTPERGFQEPRMNSFNQYALGSVGEWLFHTVAGIDTDGPAFKHIVIRPMLPTAGLLNSVKAHYDSIHGRIESHWWIEGDRFCLDVTVPVNTTATVYIPAIDETFVTESGKRAQRAKGVEFLGLEQGAAVYRVGSGCYQFRSERRR